MQRPTAEDYRARAAEMRKLADQSLDPNFKRSCLDMADGWSLLALQQDALDRAEDARERRPDPPSRKQT